MAEIMAFQQEQTEEIETLKSIFPLEIVEKDGKIQIWLKPTDSMELDEATIKEYTGVEDPEGEVEHDWDTNIAIPQLILNVIYPETYPEVAPNISLNTCNTPSFIHPDEGEELYQQLVQVSKENLGMVHIFSLISHARDYLEFICSKRLAEAEAARMERIRIADEVDRKRTEGTKVTPQSFSAWKKKFDAEKHAKDPSVKVVKKMTGKRLFEENKGLVDSDLKELGQDDTTVDVDLSLFEAEALDELDIEDGIVFSDSDNE
jgi:hypothetical protein